MDGCSQSLLPVADTGCMAARGGKESLGWSTRHATPAMDEDTYLLFLCSRAGGEFVVVLPPVTIVRCSQTLPGRLSQ